MMIEYLIQLFEQDLIKLSDEINSYKNESALWVTGGDIKNSGGNLCLHLIGNLRHFIGFVLGGSDYKRERDKEFSLKDIPRSKLIEGIGAAKEDVISALKKLNEKDLKKIYPVNVFKQEMTTEYFLLRLYGHLNYHFGQINYHRRLLEK